jgi:hypothetical protein
MDVHKLFKPFLFISLGITLFRYTAWFYDLDILKSFKYINIPFMLTYTIIALREIYRSNNTSLIEKIMWTLVFLNIINQIAAIVYLLFARKRILREFKLLYMENGSFKTAH